ncbi:MAG TPA: capsule assembly Wzi family protein [Longimicrobiales bacterium]|nr:capsule assembly Wzi family protein [Longimicrobiales bacterium]
MKAAVLAGLRRPAALWAVLAALCGVPAAAAAQAPLAATPLLPPDHWAYAALARLDAVGVAGPGYDVGAGSLAWSEAVARLERAAADPAAGAGVRRLAAGYLARLREEVGDAATDTSGAARFPGWVGGGFASQRGGLLAGYDRDEVRFAPAPVPAQSAPFGSALVAARAGRIFAGLAVPRWSAHEAALDEAYVAAGAGRVRGWAGRRRVGYGAGADRSVVLGGAVALDGAGVFTATPFRLPSVLRLVGPVRVEAAAARLHRAGGVAVPWFVALRVAVRPHPRLALAASRAAAFGGRGNAPIGWHEVPVLLIGHAGGAHGETENQVASVAARWRPPAGALPLVLYGEWGFDDVGNSYFHVPGVVAGLQLATVPGVPALGVGVERASFAGHCCGNPPWYRHSALPWMDRRIPLGHPLGGQGDEWLAYARADLADARLRLDARAFRRHRGPENLFAPARQGRSLGGALEVALRPYAGLEAFAAGAVEDGVGWRETSLEAGVRVRY